MSNARVAILYPSDPAGSVPSGIDAFIRGILKWSPPDLSYVLYGASSDISARPIGREAALQLGDRELRYVPIVCVDPKGTRSRVPLTVRYLWALRDYVRRGELRRFDALDFHRIEPVSLFMRDTRPKNLFLHQDMAAIRDPNSDIMWRHAPWLYEAIERRLMESVNVVLAVRRSAVERYTRAQPRAAGKFRFLPTWMDNAVFKPCESEDQRASIRAAFRQRLGIAGSATLLAFAGRLDRQKDPLLLLEAFRLVACDRPELHLVIVGDGVLRPRVEEEISARGLQQRVTLLGVQPAAAICEALQASDLFVLSSAYEGMPIALLEALATGLPVVSTHVGEVPNIVQNGVNGFVSHERAPESLALALRRALAALASLRGQPCTDSVLPYQPQAVLGRLYDIHRREARKQAA
jgi:glycosyltransferase involved in cell wall biosynthesis